MFVSSDLTLQIYNLIIICSATIRAKDDENVYQTLNIDNAISEIQSKVSEWFTSYGGEYTDVFSAISDGGEHVTELIQAYTTTNF